MEGHPVKKEVAGQTSVGVAAAAKLYFTVLPANFFVGIYYRIASLFNLYSPWSWIVFGLIVFTFLLFCFSRFFSFKFGISIKKK